jgi:potassium-dependent mechanosensitive channel
VVLPVSTASSAAPAAGNPSWIPGWLGDAWGWSLLDLQGTQITVGSLITFTLILAIGIPASRMLGRLAVRIIARRGGVHPGSVSAAESLIFYSLLTVVVLLALKAVNVPLSVFAVAGGALAIGVGFGSQNILNNFISGLILLIERPIRVGDIIQLDGQGSLGGVVRRIGARSTRIVTGDNLEVVVPNSTLLQQNVINWTLSDDEVRATVAVGVAYGSPLEAARDCLLRVAGEHEKILKSPAPVVLVEDFADSAIVLRLYFWMRIRRAFERRVVESDLRLAIDRTLRESGIIIAFPQRDVHIDASSPLAVRVIGADAPPKGPPAERA